MSEVKRIEIQDLNLWDHKKKQFRALYSFDLELTARCNLNCRHCYINLPANDKKAKEKELTLQEIEEISDQAIDLGAVWVLLSGGEPLLRKDFVDIYLMLKHKGLLVSVFTNATMIKPEHVKLFTRFPPRDIEVTIYGSQKEIYERVTRKNGSFSSFLQGLNLLFEAGVRIRLKAMAMRSNIEDLDAITEFGQKYTKDFYRFDPVLHLRYDHDKIRNDEIRSERLSPKDIIGLEMGDKRRFDSLKRNCDELIIETFKFRQDDHLFHCGAGNGNFSIGYDGTFKLCSSLSAPGTTVNLREVSLRKAWQEFVPQVRNLRIKDSDYLRRCAKCSIMNLCLNCPAHAFLETGKMDSVVPYFCDVAFARAEALKN